MTNTKYTATIGIECHVQLKTVSKLFSGAGNDAREAAPNTLINHIDFGLPGALPVFNKAALALASRAALALKTKPQQFSTFDRKHYFYPDLPMGYQITQYDQPIILGGQVNFLVDGQPKTVRITRAHLESDAGKSTHPAGKAYSLVDLNRAGTPLLEIVSEPDMHTAAEAKAYAKELYLLMRYADVTLGDLYHGNMRFDVNVSVSPNDSLGVRTETKNLNSFRSIEKAIEYEIKRQIEVLESGQVVVQETRGWNDAKGRTTAQRSKENADDYRYMPDPDLPPLVIDEKYIADIENSMPPLPDKLRADLADIGLDSAQIDTLIEANVDFADAAYLKLLADYNNNKADARTIANWLVNIDIPLAKEKSSAGSLERPKLYAAVLKLQRGGQLSSTNAKELIQRCLGMLELPTDLEDYARSNGLIQQSDTLELTKIVEQVLRANPKAVADVNNGEAKAIGFLLGQVMAQTKGQANPGVAKQIIEDKLKP